MESESRREQPEDQLQGTAIQDQKLQSGSGQAITAEVSSEGTQVVVHLNDRLVRGFIDRSAWLDEGNLSRNRRVIHLRTIEGAHEELSLDDAKAVFFVRAFNESSSQPALRFHDNSSPADSLWIRLTFRDGEILEGMIENGRTFLLDPGFLVTPTDPTGNNWLIYVLKTQVCNFQVLGLRHRKKAGFVSLRDGRPNQSGC